MPNAMFDTRTMMQALDLAPQAETWLRDRYFSNVKEFDTAKLEIDVRKGKRRMAPFVHPKIGGKTVERQGYRVDTFEAPEVSPDMVTTADQMLQRSIGENVYGATDPNTRAARQLGEELVELDEIITRREEWMASQALFTGGIEVKGEGYDEVLSYWPTDPAERPYLELAAGDRWNEATSDPLLDLRTQSRAIRQGSGINPTEVILGTDALEALLANETFAKQLDNRRIDLGHIDPQRLPNGVTYWGYHKGAAVDIYTYDEWYLDEETGEETPMVPLKSALLGSPNVRTTMAYGCVTLMRGSGDNAAPEFYAARRVPDSWTQRKNPAGRIVQIKSRPLPIIHQIDGFFVMKVLA